MNEKLKKAQDSYKSLIGYLGMLEGTKGFFLKCFNRKQYHEYILKRIKVDFDELILQYKLRERTIIDEDQDKKEKHIWVFWYQGETNMPHVVRDCYKSIVCAFSENNYQIHLVTKENFAKYVDIESIIIDKMKNGTISLTHFSDILRFNLLYKYGGVWLDATCFLISPINDEIFQTEFYSQKYEANKSTFFNQGKWSVFFMAGKKDGLLFKYMVDFFNRYWEQNSVILDYFLIDYALLTAYNNIPVIKEIIDSVKCNNSGIMFISNNWNKASDLNEVKNNLKSTQVVKLSWKENYNAKPNTVFSLFKKCYIDEEKEGEIN